MTRKTYGAFIRPGHPREGAPIHCSDERIPGCQEVLRWGPGGPEEWGETSMVYEDTQARDARGVELYWAYDYGSIPADQIEIREVDPETGEPVEGGYRKALAETPEARVCVSPLTPREHATILAALRFWQRCALAGERVDLTDGLPLHEAGIATDAGDALSLAEIDDLCERING